MNALVAKAVAEMSVENKRSDWDGYGRKDNLISLGIELKDLERSLEEATTELNMALNDFQNKECRLP